MVAIRFHQGRAPVTLLTLRSDYRAADFRPRTAKTFRTCSCGAAFADLTALDDHLDEFSDGGLMTTPSSAAVRSVPHEVRRLEVRLKAEGASFDGPRIVTGSGLPAIAQDAGGGLTS